MKKILIILALIISLSLFTGCKTTQYVPVTEISYVDRYLQEYVHDTCYTEVVIKEKTKNDTVYLTKTEYVYKEHFLRDTVSYTRVDSVPVVKEVEIIREVRKVPTWSKYTSLFGLLCMLIIIYKIYKKIKNSVCI